MEVGGFQSQRGRAEYTKRTLESAIPTLPQTASRKLKALLLFHLWWEVRKIGKICGPFQTWKNTRQNSTLKVTVADVPILETALEE